MTCTLNSQVPNTRWQPAAPHAAALEATRWFGLVWLKSFEVECEGDPAPKFIHACQLAQQVNLRSR